MANEKIRKQLRDRGMVPATGDRAAIRRELQQRDMVPATGDREEIRRRLHAGGYVPDVESMLGIEPAEQPLGDMAARLFEPSGPPQTIEAPRSFPPSGPPQQVELGRLFEPSGPANGGGPVAMGQTFAPSGTAASNLRQHQALLVAQHSRVHLARRPVRTKHALLL